MSYKKPVNNSKHDIHPLDAAFYYIGSRWLMLLIWILIISLGVALSIKFEDWSWLSRFGAIGVMIGTLLTLSPLFRGGIYFSMAEISTFGGTSDEDGKPVFTSPESRYIANNIVIGVILIVLSSVINAFGDYIVKAIL